MTLGQAKQIVRFLLDAEVYFQYEQKLNTYFDLGQRRIACTTDFLTVRTTLSMSRAGSIKLNERFADFYRLKTVSGEGWEKRSPTELYLPEGEYELCYERYPARIDDQTPEDYSFEISEFSQTALPYFVASQITIAEHDLRYHQVYSDEFAAILENAATARGRGEIRLVSLERSRL